MPPPSPFARPCFPPAPRPPVRPTLPFPPRCRGRLAAFTRGAAAPLRWTLAPLRFARGMAAPASATAPPLTRRGAACAGGWPSSPRRHACGVHGWAPGGTRSLALARLRLGRCPRREDRRGSSRRSAALSWPPAAAPPCGLRVGARAWMRYAAARREPNPASDPRSPRHASRSGLAYARRSNPPRTADFQRRLSVRAFQGHFSALSGALGPKNGPPRPLCASKRPPKALQAACNSPRASRYA